MTYSVEKLIESREEYENIRFYARGGMSEIYLAHQIDLDREVVIKVLKPEIRNNPEVLERFKREAKAMATVLHQNVAHVHQYIETIQTPYIVMEFIEGVDLSLVIEKMGALPIDVSAAICLGMAEGLGEIHRHQLVHRDIKPSNIRLSNKGEVKLMDFGIALDRESTSLTRPGTMVGSPSYLSPEQVLGDYASAQSDIFLLGICLYEMLCGARPFVQDDRHTVYQNIRQAQYIPLHKMNSKVPAKLEYIVQKCLEKKPQNRYPSTESLKRDLQKFLGKKRMPHKDTLILQFLDEEAFLTPAMEYSPIEKKKSLIKSLLGID